MTAVIMNMSNYEYFLVAGSSSGIYVRKQVMELLPDYLDNMEGMLNHASLADLA